MAERKRRGGPKGAGSKKHNEFEIYASFIALPRDERNKVFGFNTDDAFAQKYKLHGGTLSDWKKDEKLWKLRNVYMLEFRKYTADVLRGLYLNAVRRGSGADAKAWFELVEGLKQEVEHSGTVTFIVKKFDEKKKK